MCSDSENGLLKGLLPQAIEFFAVFSRFEFALKQAGYLENDAEGAGAMPGWDCFAIELGIEFFKQVKDGGSARVLFDNPPGKQIVKIGAPRWKKVAAPTGAKELFLAVRRVRNNLFHGGKFPTGPVDEPARNPNLLDACLYILKEALDECEKREPADKLKVLHGHFIAPL